MTMAETIVMNQPTPELNEQGMLFTLRMIWGSLLISQMMYVAVPHFLGPAAHTFFDPQYPLSIPFVALTVAFSLFAYILPNKIWANNAKEMHTKKGTPTGVQVLQNYFVGFFIRLALLEAIAMLGFVLGFFNHDPFRVIPFVTLSMLGFLKSFPTLAKAYSSLGIHQSLTARLK